MNNRDFEVYAVRGNYTRSFVPNSYFEDLKTINRTEFGEFNANEIAFGDPGLLLPFVFGLPKAKRMVDVCLIPHFRDVESVAFQRILTELQSASVLDFYKKHHVTVDVISIGTCDIFGFLTELSGCRSVFSSSLHGIVFAISYGIPALRLKFSSLVIDSKFVDFYSGINFTEGYSVKNPLHLGKWDLNYTDLFRNLKSVPKINLEKLWKNCPFSAENIDSEEYSNFVKRFFKEKYSPETYKRLF